MPRSPRCMTRHQRTRTNFQPLHAPRGYCEETQHGERDHHDMRPEDRLSYLYGGRCVHFISVFIARYWPACYAGECARLQVMGSSGRSDAARRLHRGRRRRGQPSDCDRVELSPNWDCINAGQRNRAKRSLVVATSSRSLVPVQAQTGARAATLADSVRGTPLRQTHWRRKADSNS